MTTDPELLPSWRPGATRDAVVGFLDAARDVPVDARVAMVDNDGTLWCEKPAYPQLAFLLGELDRAVADDPGLADVPEYRALVDQDRAAQAELGLERIAVALVELCAGIEPEEFTARVRDFVATAAPPTLPRRLPDLRYAPMLELLDELRRRDFDIAIVTGGGTEFVRAISRDFYGVEPERVVGSRVGYRFARDDDDRPRLVRTGDIDGLVNEGEAKVVHIQRALGRRPILAAGNSPGDTEMLEYALASEWPSLALLVDHDDEDREYAYRGEAGSAGLERRLDPSVATVVSMRDDWARVFVDD